MSVRECHCCFCCCCCCCRWCFSWCCSYYSCFVDVFLLAVWNISDLICQAGSLWPRMATVWKGSNPSSISPFPTARTFGFILSIFFLIWINVSQSILLLISCKIFNSSRQVPPHGIASRSTEDLPQIFLELSRQLCPAIVPPGNKKLFLKLENSRKQKQPAASKDWEQKQVGLMLVQIQRVEAGQGFPLPRRGSQRPARFDRDPPDLDWTIVKWFQSTQLILVCTLGCPKKPKSPNFGSQPTPLVFIG